MFEQKQLGNDLHGEQTLSIYSLLKIFFSATNPCKSEDTARPISRSGCAQLPVLEHMGAPIVITGGTNAIQDIMHAVDIKRNNKYFMW